MESYILIIIVEIRRIANAMHSGGFKLPEHISNFRNFLFNILVKELNGDQRKALDLYNHIYKLKTASDPFFRMEMDLKFHSLECYTEYLNDLIRL